GDVLGSLLLTGSGVGLTLPTLMATAAASLPPTSFATGSAVVNMLRQVGLAIGVAVFIAVLGSPRSPAATLAAYQRAWVVTAAIALAGGLVAIPLLMSRRRRVVEAPALAVGSG
ncbi:MAG: MFS transporter, partial [Solirubrobacteraceae bacterium]